MSATNLVWSDGAPSGTTFRGLSISSGSHTLLDGNVGSNWFYAVGSSTNYGARIPASDSAEYRSSATRMSLYVGGGSLWLFFGVRIGVRLMIRLGRRVWGTVLGRSKVWLRVEGRVIKGRVDSNILVFAGDLFFQEVLATLVRRWCLWCTRSAERGETRTSSPSTVPTTTCTELPPTCSRSQRPHSLQMLALRYTEHPATEDRFF